MSDTEELSSTLNRDSALQDSDDDSDDDADYIPSDDAAREMDSEDDEEEQEEEEGNGGGPAKNSSTDLTVTSVEEKKKTDALWSSFLSDVGTRPKSKQSQDSASQNQSSTSKTQSQTKSNTQTTSITTDLNTQASTSASIGADKTKTEDQNGATPSAAPKRKGGLNAVLGFINKKQKISTLDKSKLDWEKYKTEAGLTDELRAHTTSNNSYLEKKEFLERADHRQFEQERNNRLSSSSRRNPHR